MYFLLEITFSLLPMLKLLNDAMPQLAFDQPDLFLSLVVTRAEALDDLEFGVIGFDAETAVTH